MSETEQKRDVYAIITNRIIEQLVEGVVPWHQSWKEAGMPQNLITKKPYNGINALLLAFLGYEQNYFLTFKQVNDLRGSVRKGEKSHTVVFWKWPEKKKDETEEEKEKKRKPILRYYLVFNIAQCDNIPEKYIPKIKMEDNRPIDVCEEIIEWMPNRPAIIHDEAYPFYQKVKDLINMPKKELFDDSEAYYEVLFHELIHSTGHTSRLNRKELMDDSKDIEAYSLEELTAEIGACFLNNHAGIGKNDFGNSAAYIQGYLEVLKNDKRFIFYASSRAQRAVDYIFDIHNSNGQGEPQKEEVIKELEDISDIL